MKIEKHELKSGTTLIVTLYSKDIPSFLRDEYCKRMVNAFRCGIPDENIKILVVWDNVIENITIIEPI